MSDDWPRKKKAKHDDNYLKIQITRDRLVDNIAFQNLTQIVRWSVDFYAMKEAARAFAEAEAERDTEPLKKKVERVEEVLEDFKDDIASDVYLKLRKNVEGAISAVDSEAEATVKQLALLGPLATAGISALAYNHELNKQIHSLSAMVVEIQGLAKKGSGVGDKLLDISKRLEIWIKNTESTRDLFLHLAEPENRELRERLKALPTINTIKSQTSILTRGIDIDTEGVSPDLRLPKGSFAEWSAIFQNIFVNATNAMLDSESRLIAVTSHRHGKKEVIAIQDTGHGVDLEEAEDLFKPFVRKSEISPARRALGFGGMGMGLTIVRMIASNLGCKVAFASPDEGFNTSVQLTWNESE